MFPRPFSAAHRPPTTYRADGIVAASVAVAMMLASGCQRSEPASASTPPPAAASHPEAIPAPAPSPAQPLPGYASNVPSDYGTTQPVRPDANPQAASVAQALKERNHPERLSPIIAPAPFDLAAYRRNPQAYLNVIEPGRVFQVAQPGPDVPRIMPLGPLTVSLVQGASVPLQVRVPPGMPVTFTSFDLGCFAENQLTSITVAANDQGIAQATFVGASGTIGDVNLLAACPITAGQLTYRMTVTGTP